MAWIEPKRDWTETDYCSYEDMNRIAGNLNELGGTNLRSNYTQDDVVPRSQWTAIVSAVNNLIETEGYTTDGVPDMSMTALNFNVVEGLTKEVKDWIDLKEHQHVADIYAGDDLYAADYDQYARGGD